MTRKVVSFLGYTPPNRPYQPTTYVYDQMEHSTPFMAEAAVHFFKPDRLLVLVTQEAKAQNFGDLCQNLEGVITPIPIDIPSGQHEQELGEIFAAIAGNIKPDDTIIFDITNGFRSLPVLAFLATSFVRIVRGASVERMVYGAFDAKDKVHDRTPVFDLTPFLTLLDWTTRTDAFLKFGRADFAALMTSSASQVIQELAKTLDMLSSSLYMSRTQQAMEQAATLQELIQETTTQLSTAAGTMPFTILLEQIKNEYAPLALAKPVSVQHRRAALSTILRMINWYREKKMLLHAATLATEWCTAVARYQDGQSLFCRFNERKRAIENKGPLSDLYQRAKEVRNDVAHCGMEPSFAEAKNVEEAVTNLCQELPNFLPDQ